MYIHWFIGLEALELHVSMRYAVNNKQQPPHCIATEQIGAADERIRMRWTQWHELYGQSVCGVCGMKYMENDWMNFIHLNVADCCTNASCVQREIGVFGTKEETKTRTERTWTKCRNGCITKRPPKMKSKRYVYGQDQPWNALDWFSCAVTLDELWAGACYRHFFLYCKSIVEYVERNLFLLSSIFCRWLRWERKK